MRTSLAAMRESGIRRCHFSATFAGISATGHIILTNVRGPVGDRYQHMWIPECEWQTRLPRPGKHVELVALVDEYQRDRDNSVDYGLFQCREVMEE